MKILSAVHKGKSLKTLLDSAKSDSGDIGDSARSILV